MVFVVRFLILSLTVTNISAQTTDDRAAAEQLFNEGRELVGQGDYEAAVDKFEASLGFDLAAGTAANLAVCYEQLGKLASAWAQYRQVVALEQRTGNKKREAFARASAKRLEPRLPRLVINIPPDVAAIAGLEVSRNGSPVEAKSFNVSRYVDPGKYKIRVTAPGYEPFSTEALAKEAHEEEVLVSMLIELPPKDDHEKTQVNEQKLGSRGIGGVITGTIGLVSVGVGLGVGRSAISTWRGAFDNGLCNEITLECNTEGKRITDTGLHRASISNVLVGIGLTALAAGAVMYLTDQARSRSARSRKQRAKRLIFPTISQDMVGLAVSYSR